MNKRIIPLSKRPGDIAILAGGCNVDLSGNGKLVCVFLTYKRKNIPELGAQCFVNSFALECTFSLRITMLL